MPLEYSQNPSDGTHKSRRQRDRIFGPVQKSVLLTTRVCSTAQQRLRMSRQQIGKSLKRTQCISELCHHPVQITMKLRIVAITPVDRSHQLVCLLQRRLQCVGYPRKLTDDGTHIRVHHLQGRLHLAHCGC